MLLNSRISFVTPQILIIKFKQSPPKIFSIGIALEGFAIAADDFKFAGGKVSAAVGPNGVVGLKKTSSDRSSVEREFEII